MEGPFTINELNGMTEVERSNCEVCGHYRLELTATEHFEVQLDTSMQDALNSLDDEERDSFLHAIAKMFVEAADGIDQVITTCSSDNTSGDPAPSVLPQQLVNTEMPQFTQLLRPHQQRLLTRLLKMEVHIIGQELTELQQFYNRNDVIRGELDDMNDGMSFSDS